MRSSRIVIVVIILFLLVAGVWKAWHNAQYPHKVAHISSAITHDGDTLRVRADSPLQARLTVEPVTLSSQPNHIEIPAQVIPVPGSLTGIYTPVTGRVANIRVQPGQSVQQGDVLAILYSGDLAQAWSDQRKALSALTFARETYDRAKAVLRAGGNAVKDLQSARNDLEQAQAEATRTQRHLDALGSDSTVSNQVITAPFSGIIGKLSISPGQNITDTSNALMTLVNTQDVWIEASLPEINLPLLRPNLTLSASFEGQICSGPITARDPILNNDTRRLSLYLRCANPENLLYPGQFTTAFLSVPSHDHILVPKTALLMNNENISVFIETAPNTYRRRFIDISYDGEDNVSIHKGLTEHDRIVTHGAILLNDG